MRARYRRITRFAARYLVQTWWFELFLPRIGLGGLAARAREARLQRIAQRFHALAVDLGGLMIKVGQFMSSRLDVLPPEITKELEGLQDEVPPVPFDAIRALAEAELGVPLERAYSFVDPTPLAAASLGQAHRARLSDADAADTGLTRCRDQDPAPGHRSDRRRRPAGAASRRRLAEPRAPRLRPRRHARPGRGVRRTQASRRSTTSTRRPTPSASPQDFADDARVQRSRDRVGAHHAPRADAAKTSRRSRSPTSTGCGRRASTRPRSRSRVRRRHVRPAVQATASSTPTRTPATSSSRRTCPRSKARPPAENPQGRRGTSRSSTSG